MKTISLFLSIVLLSLFSVSAQAQCDPMGPDECPDPENNGEICPEVLPMGFLDQLYSEVATILVPETDTNGIALHHLTLASLDDLPPGLTWVSNDTANEFMAGNYYCILMEGTPTVADTFFLKIVLDIYIDFNGTPVYIMQVTDSTSLSMVIVDNAGLGEDMASVDLEGNFPNPFSGWTTVRFEAYRAGQVAFEVYSLLGERVHEEKIPASQGENVHLFNGAILSPGTYFYVLRSGAYTASRMMVRVD